MCREDAAIYPANSMLSHMSLEGFSTWKFPVTNLTVVFAFLLFGTLIILISHIVIRCVVRKDTNLELTTWKHHWWRHRAWRCIKLHEIKLISIPMRFWIEFEICAESNITEQRKISSVDELFNREWRYWPKENFCFYTVFVFRLPFITEIPTTRILTSTICLPLNYYSILSFGKGMLFMLRLPKLILERYMKQLNNEFTTYCFSLC